MRIKTRGLPFVYLCRNCGEDIRVYNVLEMAQNGCTVTCANCKTKYDVDIEEIRVYLREVAKALEEGMAFCNVKKD